MAISGVTVNVVNGRTVLVVGRLDAASVRDARTELHAVLAQGTGDLDVDVAGVEIGDATGLGLLVGLHRGAERCERRLVLHGVPPRLLRMLRATRLLRILHVASAVRTEPALSAEPAARAEAAHAEPALLTMPLSAAAG